MNYLELGRRFTDESGATNVNLTTMTGQKGESRRFTQWIAQAWNEIQTLHDDWEWMRKSNLMGSGVSFVPAPGQAYIPLGVTPDTIGLDIDDFGGKWCIDSFRNYSTDAGPRSEIFMTEISYDWWRDSYMYGANRFVQTRPVVIGIAPDKGLCIGPPSNGLYTVTGDYYRSPTVMVADTDVPLGLPKKYHMAIVFKAMTYYGSYEAAPEVQGRGEEGFDQLIRELEAYYGPRVVMGGALA